MFHRALRFANSVSNGHDKSEASSPPTMELPKVSIGNLKIAKMLDIRLFWVAERVQREVLSILGGNSGINGHDLPLEA